MYFEKYVLYKCFSNVVLPERLAPINIIEIPPLVGSVISNRLDSNVIP